MVTIGIEKRAQKGHSVEVPEQPNIGFLSIGAYENSLLLIYIDDRFFRFM